jgi:hypothetical protein
VDVTYVEGECGSKANNGRDAVHEIKEPPLLLWLRSRGECVLKLVQGVFHLIHSSLNGLVDVSLELKSKGYISTADIY